MLNSKELREIVTNFDEENVQQVGIDLNLIRVQKINGGGFIPKTGKSLLPIYEEVKTELLYGRECWELQQGTYIITLQQGCNLPENIAFEIVQRSSLMRCGAIIRSSVFDPGFRTDNIGTILIVHETIIIEKGARVGQIVAHSCTPVQNLYEGQFQNDKQRK